tara:strand:+ start:1323 stop:1973 length:651 start_codon:yes stop_codon:yes gene_type:complete
MFVSKKIFNLRNIFLCIIFFSTLACTPKNINLPIKLFDEKRQKRIPFASYREILVSPTIDIRNKKRQIGIYRWFNVTHKIVTEKEEIKFEIDKIIESMLLKKGFKIKKGSWNESPYSLRFINSPYVLSTKIKNLNFYGNASFPNNVVNGVVTIDFKLGITSRESVYRTTIELRPKKKTILSSEKSEDLSFLKQTVKSTILNTIEDGLEKLLRKISN